MICLLTGVFQQGLRSKQLGARSLLNNTQQRNKKAAGLSAASWLKLLFERPFTHIAFRKSNGMKVASISKRCPQMLCLQTSIKFHRFGFGTSDEWTALVAQTSATAAGNSGGPIGRSLCIRMGRLSHQNQPSNICKPAMREIAQEDHSRSNSSL